MSLGPANHKVPFLMSSNLLSNRQRKDELEQRMSALQESRRELMVQLEGLMRLLKVRLELCATLTAPLAKPQRIAGPRNSFQGNCFSVARLDVSQKSAQNL